MPKNVCDEVVHGELLIDAPRGPMSEFCLSFPRMSFLTIRGIRLFSHAMAPHLALRKWSRRYYIFIRSLVLPCRERGTEVLLSQAGEGVCPIRGCGSPACPQLAAISISEDVVSRVAGRRLAKLWAEVGAYKP